jgi:hypothetical protein
MKAWFKPDGIVETVLVEVKAVSELAPVHSALVKQEKSRLSGVAMPVAASPLSVSG